MLFPKRGVRTGFCNQLGTYWYWREQEGLHGLVFAFSQQHDSIDAPSLSLWSTVTPWHFSIKLPVLILYLYSWLSILQSGILHVLLFVLSDNFSTFFSLSWSKSILYWKCKTRADPSVGFTYPNHDFHGEGRRITEFNSIEQPSLFP